VLEALGQFQAFSARGDVAASRRKEHWRLRLLELLRQTLFERVVSPLVGPTLDHYVDALLSHQRAPHEIVDQVVAALLPSQAASRLKDSLPCGAIRLHHLGIAVESLAQAAPLFQRLVGKPPEAEETVADQKVRVAAFHLGEGRLELLEGTAADSPIARFIAKRGQGIHHLALTVPDLPKALRDLESGGVRLVDREPRVGAANEKVAFLHPSSTSGVLIELIEES